MVEVTVQTMVGVSFGVVLDEGGGSNNNVHALKVEIEEAEGAPRDRQELFMLVEGAEDGAKSLCRMVSRSRLRAQWRCV